MREYRFLATEQTQEALRLARGVWHGMTIAESAFTMHLVTGEAVRVECEAADVEDLFETFRLNAAVDPAQGPPTDAAGEFGLGRNDVVLFTGATWTVSDAGEKLGVELREGAAVHFSGHPGQLAEDADVVCLTTDAIVVATTTGTGLLLRVGLKPGSVDVVRDPEAIAAFLLERGYSPT
ncbi:MAG: hypothetical protein IT355_01755 [Gemmatimonadaceae bacterium]|nr:hypothetical protein [Gemmatimonadaceae bacterium]